MKALMTKFLFLISTCLLGTQLVSAQSLPSQSKPPQTNNATLVADGYEIKIKLNDYFKDTLLLGYPMGDKQYIKDTAILNKKTGLFTFKGSKKLAAGMYLVISPPENNYFQIIVSDTDQKFSLTTSNIDPYKEVKSTNAPDNELFYNYMSFLSTKRTEAEKANGMKKADSTKTVEANKILERLDKEVKAYQKDLFQKNAKSTTIALLRATQEIEPPAFIGADKDVAMYYFYKQHYFDNFEMSHPAFLRTPILFERINYYITKLTPQHPDSVIVSVDRILDLVKGNSETFQYYYIHFLNEYAKSKLVGFDAVYVHLAKQYMEKGLADAFIDKEQREKIMKNANALEPILLGKTAPDIEVYLADGKTVMLSKLKAKYVVFYVWDTECGHCKKSIPALVAFAEKYKDKEVKVLALCNKLSDKVADCWKEVKERKMDGLINAVDPFQISRYRTLYHVETTPALFVLDENKKIISKSIGADQLDDLFQHLLKEAEKGKK
jgi:thiol-disulfide isomerase/thioredoxin